MQEISLWSVSFAACNLLFILFALLRFSWAWAFEIAGAVLFLAWIFIFEAMSVYSFYYVGMGLVLGIYGWIEWNNGPQAYQARTAVNILDEEIPDEKPWTVKTLSANGRVLLIPIIFGFWVLGMALIYTNEILSWLDPDRSISIEFTYTMVFGIGAGAVMFVARGLLTRKYIEAWFLLIFANLTQAGVNLFWQEWVWTATGIGVMIMSIIALVTWNELPRAEKNT